ncbi:MAG: DUF2950 domain-containing protein [Aeromonas sp.]|uniref:DUF2950 domain-containing protein n=1 Tax=Aeromonas sp. TaxID=647 RepID=UPI002FC6A779
MKRLLKWSWAPSWGLALLALVCASDASTMAPRTFATPDEAVQALITALEKNDVSALTQLLGEKSEEAISSGDPVADANDRAAFVASFKSKHQLVAEGKDKMILVVGESDWPLPIPLVTADGNWYLDGAAGAKEIVYRRIGRNELGAIAVCRGFIDAQLEYAAVGHDGQTAGLFAAKLRSDAGQQNGLYWPVAKGEPASPAGEEVVSAAAEGYKAVVGQRTPYHGYYYRILYAQGAAADGGKKEYFVDGQLRDGVALIAWPADYATSGVMTFMVSHEGRVYQKDLGTDTATAVEAIQLFDPDKSWSLVVSNESD